MTSRFGKNGTVKLGKVEGGTAPGAAHSACAFSLFAKGGDGGSRNPEHQLSSSQLRTLLQCTLTPFLKCIPQ